MKHIILGLAFFSAVGAFAQDQLFKKDNSKTEVKVLEVTPAEVKYKLFSYQDGPTIIVPKSEVALIIYQDGTHETFNVTAPQQPVLVSGNELRKIRNANKRYVDSLKLVKYGDRSTTKNLVSLNLLEPLNGSIGISYMREFADGWFHVYAPLSVGVSEPYFNQPSNLYIGSRRQDFKFKRKTIEAGLGVHLQASPKRRVTYVIGPYVGIAQYTGNYEYYTFGPGLTRSPARNNFVMNRYSFMLDNGILFKIHKNCNVLLLAGLGYRKDDYLVNDPKDYTSFKYGGALNFYPFLDSSIPLSDFPINTFKLNLSVGYRF